MKLYVINLDRSPDRLKRLDKVFSDLKLGFTRIPAIDGDMLDENFILVTRQNQNWPDPLTRGEIACFLSHKAALQKVASGEDEFAAIFEDDVALSKDAASLLAEDDWIPKNADIVKIETHGKKVWLGKAQQLDNGYSVAPLKSRHIMAAGYIVSKEAAKKLNVMMEKITFPFDHFLFNPKCHVFEHFKMWQLEPAIVRQVGLKSTLEKDRSRLEIDKKNKRAFSKIIVRELKRLTSRTKTGFWGIYINCLTREKWARIKFKE